MVIIVTSTVVSIVTVFSNKSGIAPFSQNTFFLEKRGINTLISHFWLALQERNMAVSLWAALILSTVTLAQSLAVGKANRNPNPPPGLNAHMFLFSDGSVPVAEGVNPFANNAIDGRAFLTNEMGFTVADIAVERQVCTIS